MFSLVEALYERGRSIESKPADPCGVYDVICTRKRPFLHGKLHGFTNFQVGVLLKAIHCSPGGPLSATPGKKNPSFKTNERNSRSQFTEKIRSFMNDPTPP